jgi:hypothetical protein
MSKILSRASVRPAKAISRHDQATSATSGGTNSTRSSSIRHKSLRRRQIDPTTCERDYSVEELEFMQAIESYKRTSGRMFPTCSEILEVFRSLGYSRPSQSQPESTSSATL